MAKALKGDVCLNHLWSKPVLEIPQIPQFPSLQSLLVAMMLQVSVVP